MYKHLIFDADHTLIDFYADERAAFRRTFDRFGGKYSEKEVETSRILSDDAWDRAGLNDVYLIETQKNYHRVYFSHIPGLIDRIKAEAVPMSAPSQEIADFFIRELCAPSHEMGDATGVLSRLSARYSISIATNGIYEIQKSRLQSFLPFIKELFVSEKIGTIKPDPAFFEYVLHTLGAAAKGCLFVGDSLNTDVAGSLSAGMDCVWFNPSKRPLPPEYSSVRQISALTELEEWL